MGSFTEVSLAFYFRQETPREVLATFAPLRPHELDDSYGSTAPDLPAFEPVQGDDWWAPDWREDHGPDHVDPLAEQPWRHDWARWLPSSMSASTLPSAALAWSGPLQLWHFECRFSLKVWPSAVLEFLGWLGPFIRTSDNARHPRPDLIGVLNYDSSLRPYLLFCQYGLLTLQNLNGPGEEF